MNNASIDPSSVRDEHYSYTAASVPALLQKWNITLYYYSGDLDLYESLEEAVASGPASQGEFTTQYNLALPSGWESSSLSLLYSHRLLQDHQGRGPR